MIPIGKDAYLDDSVYEDEYDSNDYQIENPANAYLIDSNRPNTAFRQCGQRTKIR